MRTDVVAVAIVAVIVLGSVSADLAIYLHHDDGGPSSEECVAAWNASSNRPNQLRIAAGGWKRGVVDGWMAKETYPGCSVLLVHRPDGPWIAYSRLMAAKAWDQTSGLRWGHDNPEGPVDTDNAHLSPSGLLRLD